MKLNKNTILVFITFIIVICLSGCKSSDTMFSFTTRNSSITDVTGVVKSDTLYQSDMLSKNLCIIPEKQVGINTDSSLNAGNLLLVDIDQNNMIYADGIYDKLYPASVTKIMTALVCLKYGDLNDMVTISYKASHLNMAGAKLCFLQEGDQINLEVLLTSFLVYSGNDAGIAIAEHIAGSEEEFAKLMNYELQLIGAVDSHFVNPHGLPDENHYTTGYDIYLILNELANYDKFLEITSKDSYIAEFKDSSGNDIKKVYENTNKYLTGEKSLPNNVAILAGKTGTTYAAGSCLAVLVNGVNGHRYIAVVLKAGSSDLLYQQMTKLLEMTE